MVVAGVVGAIAGVIMVWFAWSDRRRDRDYEAALRTVAETSHEAAPAERSDDKGTIPVYTEAEARRIIHEYNMRHPTGRGTSSYGGIDGPSYERFSVFAWLLLVFFV